MQMQLNDELKSILLEMQSFRDSYIEMGSKRPNEAAYERISKMLAKAVKGLNFQGKKLTIKSFRHTYGIKRVTITGDIFQVAREGLRSDSSMAVRLDAWKYAWGETKKYPVFGNGIGSTSLGHIDNQYVRELMDTGFVGLICFLVFIGTVLKATYELFLVTEDRFVKSLTAGFLTAMVALLIHAMTIANFYTILVMETVCVMLALLMILYQATFYPEAETPYSELATDPQSPADAASPTSPGHPQ